MRGRNLPMTTREVDEWGAYYLVKAEHEEAARKEAEHAATSIKMSKEATMGAHR